MTEIKARQTLYKGIRMRSRLEADFAGFLDSTGADWAYESACFAGPDGQWLPDFRVNRGDYNVYFEVKPDSIGEDEIDPILERMTVAWLSEPTATLQLVIWPYGDPPRSRSIMGLPHEPEDGDCPVWWLAMGAREPVPWSGMGQLEHMLLKKCDEIGGQRAEAESAPMVVSEICRDEHGITALISAGDVITACGITPECLWWCECGTRIDGAERDIGPGDVCEHLRVVGNAPMPEPTTP